jgi:LuxR family transcriptional regulator, maltose regulon positive regulatory protein
MAKLLAQTAQHKSLNDALQAFVEQLRDTSSQQLGVARPASYEDQPDQYYAPERPNTLVEPLSPQEQRVLRLLGAGMSNPEIAEELVISVNTIKTHVQSIYRKLGVSSRREARALARSTQ